MKRVIEYPVLTSGTPVRTSKPRAVFLTDSMEVDIPEVAAGDLDVAAVMTDCHSGTEKTIYGMDGRLYAPITDLRGTDAEDLLSRHVFTMPDENIRKAEMYPWSPLQRQYDPILRQIRFDHASQVSSKIFPENVAKVLAGRESSTRPGFRSDFQFKELDEQPFQDAREAMQVIAEDLLVVGKELWRRCHAPVISHIPYQSVPMRRVARGSHLATAHIGIREFAEIIGHEFAVITGANASIEGERIASDISQRHDYVGAQPGLLMRETGQRVEVFDETYFEEQDTSALWLVHCAVRAANNMSLALLKTRGTYDNEMPVHKKISYNLSRISADDILLFKRMEDALSTIDDTPDYGNLADLVLQASATPICHRNSEIDNNARSIMDAAVENWDNRPIPSPLSGPLPR